MILEKINKPNDIKQLSPIEYNQLADEIRRFLIEKISKTGGHLASNLGVVELTMALHLAFNLPQDKLIWDVGHQSYTHKILTGRKNQFDQLRKFGGMSGKAIKPIALRNVYTVYDNVDIPIIGVGGISNFEDVVEFLFAGARAVQIGTSIMDEGVEVFDKINKDLEKFMNKKGYESIDEMIGLAHEEL